MIPKDKDTLISFGIGGCLVGAIVTILVIWISAIFGDFFIPDEIKTETKQCCDE